MTIRLDPDVPIVWRTPHLVQLGVDDAVCTLPSTAATERILAALVAGVPPGAIEVVAEHAGAQPGVLDQVMRLVAPALLPDHDAAGPSASGQPSHLVAIDAGEEPPAAALHALLTASGLRTIDARSADRAGSPSKRDPAPDAVVIAASFVVSPGRYGAWLSRDIPHLPIVFGDRVVEVGPFIRPGAGPCLRCISLHRRDGDAAWPVIAAQLVGTRAATLTPGGAAFAVAHAGRMLDAVLRDHDARWATRSLRIDVGTGRFSEREHRQHPDCGCRALPENVTALPHRSVERHDGPSSTTTAFWHA